MIDDVVRRPRALALRSNLPDIYGDSLGHAETFLAFGYEADQLRLALDGTLQAALPGRGWPGPSRFPVWACARWERDLGLQVREDWPLEPRVSRILAHLRGFGTATRQRVQAVANSFENGEVLVIEDYANYAVTFKFVSLLGEPPYYDAVKLAVEAIVPAHLLSRWEFTWTTYGMLTGYAETFGTITTAHPTYGDLSTFVDPHP